MAQAAIELEPQHFLDSSHGNLWSRHPFSQKFGEDARFSCPCATTATLITGRRFGNVIGGFAIVITYFGIVIGRFGNSPKSITFDRNSRSRSVEITK
jgi:hypothetical protein